MQINNDNFCSFIKYFNDFSEITGDYYYLIDLKNRTMKFSQNVLNDFSFISNDCSVNVWLNRVYQLDLLKINSLINDIVSNKRQQYSISYRLKNNDGKYIWLNSRGKCYLDDDKPRFVLGNFFKKNDLSVTDFDDRQMLCQELKMIYKHGYNGFVLLIGIDNFRSINLKFGIEYGDNLIKQLFNSLSKYGNTIFRVNGNCFCIYFINVLEDDIKRIFLEINNSLKPYCSISCGCVSIQKYDLVDGSMLLEYVESTLEEAKKLGPKRLLFFSAEEYEKKLMSLQLYEELYQAINNDYNGFSLYYQPQVYSENFEIFGAEALLRFYSPSRRMLISPNEFIPILEKNNMMYGLGLWVLKTAFKQCLKWREKISNFHISVNMSYMQLSNANICKDVLDVLKESGLAGNAVTIEITESAQLQDFLSLNSIFSLWKKEGIEISIDDFGTGYSGLSVLKELAIDEIKIDRSFIRGINNSAYNIRLLSNILQLADSFKIRVCCEGVENILELNLLEQLHTNTYQGYLFSKPCQASDFIFDYSKWQEELVNHSMGESIKSDNANYDNLSLKQEHSILSSTDDIISLCDVKTYEIYYLNKASQKMFGIKDYKGRKCFKVFYGLDAPCDFCPNKLLRYDKFYVWENWNSHCNKHFLFKDKIINIDDKKMRMQIGMDITKREYTSQKVKERIYFSQKIVGYVEILNSTNDFSSAVNRVLASIGDFYKACRAYLFERNSIDINCWDNTYEWCSDGVKSQRDKLQNVSGEIVRRWIDIFKENKSIIIYNIETIKSLSLLEYQELKRQNIKRLISVPIFVNKKLVAFIGVDDPQYSIQDDSQARILACFLANKYMLNSTKTK